MNILGIESSCDETGAAVVKDGSRIISNVVVTSLKIHQKYGGIIPEIASRRQLECVHSIVDQALTEAKLKLKDIDSVAVTQTPGLIGSLLVGTSFAQALSFAINKPLIRINHIEAHIYANFLSPSNPVNNSILAENSHLPAIGLVVSGGHTCLFHIKNLKKFRLIGNTRDDAVGETFDKVGKILGLGYPGGPVIDRLAQKGANPNLTFTCAQIPDSLDFSFSGIKTAVLYYYRDHKNAKDFSINSVAKAFQDSVIAILVKKCISACQKFKTKTLFIGGGVAANSGLRNKLNNEARPLGIKVYFPPIPLCLDNAAMIAGLGYHKAQ